MVKVNEFTRLITKMDEVAGRLNEEVIMQIGSVPYEPKHAKFFSHTSYQESLVYFKQASLVVGHGGAGTILNALRFQVPIVVVPRSQRYGEHFDDHQIELAQRLGGNEFIKVVYDMKLLESAHDNRSKLLNCALELFAKRGYEATSVQEIVEAALEEERRALAETGALVLRRGGADDQRAWPNPRRGEARKRLLAILKVRFDDPAALHELARIEAQEGRLSEAIKWLEKARESREPTLAPMLFLVELHHRQGDVRSALSLAQELATRHADSLVVQEVLGRAYLAANRPEQARITFRNMARMAGYDTPSLTRVARLLTEAGDLDAARSTLAKALENKPDDLQARIASAELDLKAGRAAAAEQTALRLRNAYPGSVAVRHLLGAIYMTQRNWNAAATEYQAALERQPNTDNALVLYRAHVAAGNAAAAVAHLEGWLRQRPGDDVARRALAEGYLLMDDLQAARATYEDLRSRHPKDVGILNNLANVLARLRQPQALERAREAHALAPNDANVIDTLGWVLVQEGQLQQALSYLRDARLRAPHDPVIQYHLGVALHRLGRSAEARRELQAALALSDRFEGADTARQLLAQP